MNIYTQLKNVAVPLLEVTILRVVSNSLHAQNCTLRFSSCPSSYTVYDCDANGTEPITWTVPVATTNMMGCGAPNVTQTGGALINTVQAPGTYFITYLARAVDIGDFSIRTATCNFTVIVSVDKVKPVLVCPASFSMFTVPGLCASPYTISIRSLITASPQPVDIPLLVSLCSLNQASPTATSMDASKPASNKGDRCISNI
jgi:hypothetical protein